MTLTKQQEKEINKRLNKRALFNSNCKLGDLNYTQINKIYNNVLGERK